jgi:hypothetical protein
MQTYVLSLGGKAILAFRAADDEEAQEVAHSNSMQSDLRTLKDTDGKPLWDGKADIEVLQASAAHDTEWQRSRDQAIADGEIDLDAGHDPDDWEVYFLKVDESQKGQLSSRGLEEA